VKSNSKNTITYICLPYDIKKIYSFYCARYENVKIKDFMKIGYDEFSWKLESIPENEPLYKVIKSRTIKLTQIKNKDERKYWEALKKENKIPDIYLSQKEIDLKIKETLKNGGIKNAR
jgi:hypothetical protein